MREIFTMSERLINFPTCIMTGFEKFFDELVLVFEASQGRHSSQNVLVDSITFRNDVGLHNLHHWSFQLKLTFATGNDPSVPVHLFQLETNKHSKD